MLSSLRDLLRTRAALGLFALLIIAMAGWGVNDLFAGRLGTDLAKAGPRSLTLEDFDRALETYIRNERSENERIVTRAEAVEAGVVDQLFAFSASRTASLGFAERVGASASDAAVLERIREQEAFAAPETGAFDLATYRAILRNNNFTPAEFERDTKDRLTLDYLRNATAAALQVPDILTRPQAYYMAENRKVAWFTVEAAAAGEPADPSEEDLQAFYDERRAAFEVPERRALSLLYLSPDDFIHQVEVPAEDIEAVYDERKATVYAEPGRRRFIEVVAESEAAARDALGRLAGGAAAESLQREGILAVETREAFERDIALEALAEELFALQASPGQVLGPFERNGLHIVARLEEIIPGTPQPFEEVEPLIREELARADAEFLYVEALERLPRLVGAGYDIERISEETGVPTLRYVPVDARGRHAGGLTILPLIQAEGLLDQAFDLEAGDVTDPFELETGTFLAGIRAVIPARQPDLAEVRERVEGAWRASRRGEALQTLAESLKARIDEGALTLDEAARSVGATLTRPDPSISRANFEIGLPPQAVGPVFSATEGEVLLVPGPGNGQVTLVRVEAINPPSDIEMQVLGQNVGALLDEALANDLFQALEVEIRESIAFEENRRALEGYKAGILDQQ